jgi:DNA polymerase III subunit epsilon
MAREIVLDTETTGFDPKTGDRLIEIGCIELQDLLPTGRTFHRFVHPERTIPPDAIKVHGITDDMVKDAPKFAEIVDDFFEFVGDAQLIAHNANFDRNFVDYELNRAGRPITGEPRWIDTLKLAQTRFPGMPNSLDALCKRYKISLVERTLHGALIDARLLAEVYLELRGGKERVLDLSSGPGGKGPGGAIELVAYGARPNPLPHRSTEAEHADHEAFLKKVLKDRSLWAAYGVIVEDEAAA